MAIFAAGFALRYLPGNSLEAVPFITLFPAILVAALVGGLWVGLLVAVLSFFAGWYFFLPPQNSWAIGEKGAFTLFFFAVIAGIQLFVIEALNSAVDQLSEERDRVNVLFRELQHRVANNMAFVSSLLGLQRKAAERGADATAILDQARSRLDTMARIHRRLYAPNILDQPLTAYLDGLASDILEASGAKNVVCVVQVDHANLDLTKLVALSLLINELMTNSIKHAFTGQEKGTISIRLDREAENLVLAVHDDGLGFDGQTSSDKSLGTTIIRSLANQLGGELQWSKGRGTTVRLAFPA
ncbi:histidine kinase dimerization/phosphoacceptor domain -containing protein [Bradyrhizobium diazoefficiens]|uniref:sensor histidine kinase n=1 Tax=Bradyrhizobium diazoefficiens TaxID=1355477 RepID=UPI00272960E5|nr:histidine kinase dimerization/phosphoacceptor domain -containing protein [Bradyrhizobium diazoefficiens]WLA74227.1 histidine kinase dimerization/phosphoacceptor domain -containing protein [Bradyrhizobium diazoefficiens]